MKKFVTGLSVVTMLAAGLTACSNEENSSGPAADGDTITLKMAMIDNETTNYYKGAQKIAEEVNLATDGKVQIEINAGGSLGDERVTVEMAMNGDLDIATAANSVLTNFIPEMSILDQAFLWDDAEEAHAAVDGPVGDLIEREAKAKGLHVVGYMESGFRDTFSTDPITSIGDFSGTKIRTMQNEYHIAAFESFGALPVAMAANEQFTALQQGTIDAAENATSNMLANKFYEVITNHTNTDHAFVYIMIVMSDDAWNRIPEDLRPAVLEGIEKGYKAQRDYLVEANEAAEVELKELGVEFHEIDREALKSAYEETATAKGWTFDEEWQAAIDEVKGN